MRIEIDQFFEGHGGRLLVGEAGFQRHAVALPEGAEILLDGFPGEEASCAFVRVPAKEGGGVRLMLTGGVRLESCSAGGWFLRPAEQTRHVYWLPQPPRLRGLDQEGHIISEASTLPIGIAVDADRFEAGFDLVAGSCLDLVVWRLARQQADLLAQARAVETQTWFVYASHSQYTRPADFYLHLVHGQVYGNVRTWPRYWKICDELDAYGLYLIAAGLGKATGRQLYSLIKRQIVYSVIARQAEDGGWYHGEWTDGMESHYRLVVGALLMLSAYLEDHDQLLVRTALEKGVSFLSGRAQQIDAGTWFMHDSLERGPEDIRRYPFPWVKSTALGKSPTNMLILNTHLDTIVALDRYREVTGDRRYDAQIESALLAARAVLGLPTAEGLYRLLFHILDLTLLPRTEAMRLSLPLRALKRLGWKHLVPRLHRIKARLPRLVMPNGFVDRALCQAGFSTRYQSVHVWDLVRYLRRFPQEARAKEVLMRAVDYTQGSAIRANWKEAPERQDALGFWVEALCHLCMLDPAPKYRVWLAEAVLDVEDLQLGLPPSSLGSNPEAVRPYESVACPEPTDARLRVVNLSRRGRIELLVVNPAAQAIALEWHVPPSAEVRWSAADAATRSPAGPVIPPRGWLLGVVDEDKALG